LAACGGNDSAGSKKEESSKLVAKSADTCKQAKKGGVLKLNHFQDVQGLDPGFANLPNAPLKRHRDQHGAGREVLVGPGASAVHEGVAA
jgi:hypothetical protein